jgi:hypothetical protein
MMLRIRSDLYVAVDAIDVVADFGHKLVVVPHERTRFSPVEVRDAHLIKRLRRRLGMKRPQARAA